MTQPPEDEPGLEDAPDSQDAPEEEHEEHEEDEATRLDREAGRQFGKVMLVVGSITGLSSWFAFDDDRIVALGMALVVFGVLAMLWPVELKRFLTGQSDEPRA